jgi:hypothetical protein
MTSSADKSTLGAPMSMPSGTAVQMRALSNANAWFCAALAWPTDDRPKQVEGAGTITD